MTDYETAALTVQWAQVGMSGLQALLIVGGLWLMRQSVRHRDQQHEETMAAFQQQGEELQRRNERSDRQQRGDYGRAPAAGRGITERQRRDTRDDRPDASGVGRILLSPLGRGGRRPGWVSGPPARGNPPRRYAAPLQGGDKRVHPCGSINCRFYSIQETERCTKNTPVVQ